jgi:YggT family protein
MLILSTLYYLIWYAALAIALAGVLLIALRSLFLYVDVNPFTWHARQVRRATDPVILPVRRVLVAMRLDPVVAPFVVVILLIVGLVLIVQLAGNILNTVAGILYVVANRPKGAPVAILGYLLFGLLGLYTLAIFARIIFSWVGAGYGNRLVRFLIHITEPLLRPLRKWVPMVGMFDISPMVAFLILWICQTVVAGTLLQNLPVGFF